jgi:transcriptional regulator with XRE-family HTH domain
MMSPTKSEPYRIPLKAKGYSLRTAAAALGVDFSHLHRVLKGERESASLLRRAQALPKRTSQKTKP